MPKNVTLELTLPGDDEAVQFLDGLVQTAQMTGDKATNVITLRAWLGALPQRLAQLADEEPIDPPPVDPVDPDPDHPVQ